jgi:hypothetical protein
MRELTPAEAYEQGRNDQRDIDDERVNNLRLELRSWQERYERSIKILMGIYTLTDPPPVEVGGKTMVFQNPMAAEVLRELSARIRAIPDRLSELKPVEPVR